MNRTETGEYIVHLIFSLLNNERPKEKPEGITFEDIYRMAVSHNVSVMTLSAIDMLDVKPSEELYGEWDRRRSISSAQGTVQLFERDSIFQKLEENHIEYIPLKGCILKEMYPKQEYREMTDLDIVVHEKDQAAVGCLMESLGYASDGLDDKKKDDSYRKEPFMHVEMHRHLLSSFQFRRMHIDDDFMQNPFDYAEPAAVNYRYQFTDSDTYYYLLMHLAKHYLINGAGIRQFIDLAVFRKHRQIDADYVRNKLEKNGLAQFMSDTEQLLSVWENDIKAHESIADMERIIFESGSFGSVASKVDNQRKLMKLSKDTSIVKYLEHRLFPPYKLMIDYYPKLKRAPILLPVYWVYRLIKTTRKDNAAKDKYTQELKYIIKKKNHRQSK